MQRSNAQGALGELIRARRDELEMSQEAVGLAAGTDQARISRIETGEGPRVELFQGIARALGWTGVELMRRLEEQEAAPAQAQDTEAQHPDGRAARGR